MRFALGLAVVAGVAAGGAAASPPTLEIRGAAVRVTIVPEPRTDIQVTVQRTNAQLPIRLQRLGDHVTVLGDVAHRVRDCGSPGRARAVAIYGRGAVAVDDLPQLVIHTPWAVRVMSGDAVFGAIGPSASVDLSNLGCGSWTIAPVVGRLRLTQAGSGGLSAASAGTADLSVEGSGDVAIGDVRAGLSAISSSSGAIAANSVRGPLDARVAGSGGVTINSGQVTAMTVSIAGSGAVRLRGVAQTLKASIAGSGDVTVSRVTGTVTKQVFGKGRVTVGR
jgi:hypothetical protein